MYKIQWSGGREKNKINRSTKNGFSEEVILKVDLEKLVNCFQSYRMKRNSRQGEHKRHRDLTEHGKLEAIKGEWSIGHKQRKEDESRRQGNNSMEFRHGYSSVSNGGPMKDSKCDYNMF